MNSSIITKEPELVILEKYEKKQTPFSRIVEQYFKNNEYHSMTYYDRFWETTSSLDIFKDLLRLTTGYRLYWNKETVPTESKQKIIRDMFPEIYFSIGDVYVTNLKLIESYVIHFLKSIDIMSPEKSITDLVHFTFKELSRQLLMGSLIKSCGSQVVIQKSITAEDNPTLLRVMKCDANKFLDIKYPDLTDSHLIMGKLERNIHYKIDEERYMISNYMAFDNEYDAMMVKLAFSEYFL